MAEDSGDKTEVPTPRKREEAREQGKIARSADLSAALLLMGLLMLLNMFGPGLFRAMQTLMAQMLSAEAIAGPPGVGIAHGLVQPASAVARAAAPIMLGGMVIAVAANMLQVGIIFSGKRLAPNFGVLNPLNGLGRIFKMKGLMHLLMSVLKLALVVLVAWSAAGDRMGEILGSQSLSHDQAFGLGSSIVFSVGIRIAVLLLVLALLDYGYQKYAHEQEIRMTKQEVKEEMRRMEGDPKIKQRRRQIAIQMATKRLAKDVPTADVIVTNPTHFAIALKYDSASMHAPRVVAKGQDHMARRIREIAIESGIPIIERKPLAQALYRLVEVGQEIPEQFYSAIAEILAYVYELSGKAGRKMEPQMNTDRHR